MKLLFKSLFKRQFEFRNNHSTNHVLINQVHLIKKYLDDDYYVCGIFIDLQKAFDIVNHNILLEKLKYYGIRVLANHWISCFVKNCKQYFFLHGISSNIKTIACGVPQESTLVPLLFLLYINPFRANVPIWEHSVFSMVKCQVESN